MFVFFLSICVVLLPHKQLQGESVHTCTVHSQEGILYSVCMWGLGVDRESGSDDSQCSIDWVTLCKVLDTRTCTV